MSDAFVAQAYLPITAAQDGWNSPTWSISSECFFYAAFPFFVAFLASRFRRLRALLGLLIFLIAVEAATFIATCMFITRLNMRHPGSVLAHLVIRQPLLRVREFFFGCVLGALFLRTRSRSAPRRRAAWYRQVHARNLALIGTLIGLLTLIALPARFWPWKELVSDAALRVPFTPLFGLLIFLLASGPTPLNRVLEHPAILLLGEANYALYITHWLALLPLLQLTAAGSAVPIPVALLGIVGSVVTSIGWYKLVEVPMRRMVRRVRRTPKGMAIVGHS